VKRLADQTLYEILEVPKDAPAPDIEAAVERARALYGPGSIATYSLMTPDDAALLGSRIEEAHRVLLDPEARTRYDASLALPSEEVRAAVNGTNGVPAPPFAAVPVVIPAVKAEERPPEPRAPQGSEGAAAPPAPEPAPARVPIRLDREIAPPAPTPAPVVPAAAPSAAEVPMPDDAAWTGEALRRVREARGITIQQIAERTKVTRHHVENVEGERFSALPAPVYLRGILLALARELRLDGQKVARAYLDRAAAAQQGKR
jgi:hypothetical protein